MNPFLLRQRLNLKAALVLAPLLMLSLIASSTQAQTGTPSAGQPPAAARVTNPTSGASLYLLVYTPSSYTGTQHYPALILIPGGSGAGSQSFRTPEVQGYANLGFLVVVFDPDGRGQSTGTEDNNGFIHQDGLRVVIDYAAAHPKSDGRVVLLSNSYGVTMATGVLARYLDLPVVFYIDWEGPADRTDTGNCGGGHGHLSQYACDDEKFWSQREAATFIKEILVPYQRVQSEKDHVQADNNHAILMINNATNTSYGGLGKSLWTRMNTEKPNQIYSSERQPSWIPEGVPTPVLLTTFLKQFLDGEIPSKP